MNRLEIKTTAAGRFRWAVLDHLGRPEHVSRWQSNLITDRGLDAHLGGVSLTEGNFRNRMHVGDGSGAADPADVTLGNKIGETTSSGGFSESRSVVLDGNTVRYSHTITRVYTAPSNVTIREIGFSEDPDEVNIRELLMDDGSPVSVPLLAGKKLRVDHTLTAEFPFSESATLDIEEYDAGGNKVGEATYNGTIYRPWYQANPNQDSYRRGALDPTYWGTRKMMYWDGERYVPEWNGSGYGANGHTVTPGNVLQAYTPGSFVRECMGQIPEAQGNSAGITVLGMGQDNISSLLAGVVFVLDSEEEIVKDSNHVLNVYFAFSIARPS